MDTFNPHDLFWWNTGFLIFTLFQYGQYIFCHDIEGAFGDTGIGTEFSKGDFLLGGDTGKDGDIDISQLRHSPDNLT